MMLLLLRLAFIGLAFYTESTTALTVAAGSECEAACASSGSLGDGHLTATSPSDIVCHDDEYDTTEKGRSLKACVTCLKDSEHVNGTDSDLSALLCTSTPIRPTRHCPSPVCQLTTATSQLPDGI